MNDWFMYTAYAMISMTWYFLRRKFVKGITEWTIDNNEITIRWIKRIPFLENKDLRIRWNEVKRIWTRGNFYFQSLDITINSGKWLTFYHDDYASNDDYADLVRLLMETMRELNEL